MLTLKNTVLVYQLLLKNQSIKKTGKHTHTSTSKVWLEKKMPNCFIGDPIVEHKK